MDRAYSINNMRRRALQYALSALERWAKYQSIKVKNKKLWISFRAVDSVYAEGYKESWVPAMLFCLEGRVLACFLPALIVCVSWGGGMRKPWGHDSGWGKASKMRSRSNSGVRLDYYHRIVYRTILQHQVGRWHTPALPPRVPSLGTLSLPPTVLAAAFLAPCVPLVSRDHAGGDGRIKSVVWVILCLSGLLSIGQTDRLNSSRTH